MRRELQIGGEAGRIATRSQSVSSAVSSSPVTNHHSAFLIDTPAIRNVANSLPMNTSSVSNRHYPRPSVARIFAIALLIGFGSTIAFAQPQQPAAKQLTVERI